MAREHRIAASATISAPQEKVWELLSDTSRYAEWVESTLEVVRTDGVARLGATYDERTRIAGPWKTSTHWRVTEFDPPHRQVHEGTGVGTVQGLGYRVSCFGQRRWDRALNHLSVTPRFGLLGVVIAKVVTGTITAEQRRGVASFAALATRDA